MPMEAIGEFCRKWGVAEFSIFGSVLRSDFGPDSDIDVLVSFDAGTRRGMFELMRMEEDLKGVFGRDVDLLTRKGVEMSDNAERRQQILNSAEVLHVRR